MELCLDLGIRNTGWSVFRDGYLIDLGVWKTVPVKEVAGQISIQAAKDALVIACGLKMAFYNYPEINRVMAELPGGSRSAKAAALMKMATGLAIGACVMKDIIIDWISPRSVKQYSTGNPQATKKEIIAWVMERYRDWAPKPFPKAAGKMEHIADSIAAYHAYKRLHGESHIGEAKDATIGSVPGRSGRSSAGKKAIRLGRILPALIRDQAPRHPRIMGYKVVSGLDQGTWFYLKEAGG